MNIEMFNDPTGKTSISRLLYAFCVVVFMLTWAWNSRDGMTPVDPAWIGVLAVIAGQKTGQSFAERK
ncbi:MAG TPA: hypothetical protein EYP35_03880 [Desulfobacterales bacterium]|nr:hypothetical protein [Desulfobacterales bacterium]